MRTLKRMLIVASLALTVSLISSVSSATPVNNKVFGLGLEFGDPTALTGKFISGDLFGVQFFVGGGDWIFIPMFLTGIDFVWHPTMIHEWRTCALNWTIGFGPALGVFSGGYWRGHHHHHDWYHGWDYYDDHAYVTLFLRMVTGVNLWFKKFPLEAFVELTPSLQFINPRPISFHLFWIVAGARWYF